MDKYIEMVQAQGLVEKSNQWMKWVREIPYIAFPADWKIAIIPPFGGAIARFLVRRKDTDKRVSVYLDCYDRLGCYGEPYWEVYPHDGDVYRCAMDETDLLLSAIEHSLAQIEKEATINA